MKALKITRHQRKIAAIPLYNIVVIGWYTFYNAWLLKTLNRHIFATFLALLLLAAAWIPLLVLTTALPYCWAWLVPLAVLSVYVLPLVWLIAQRRSLIAAVNTRQIFTDKNGVCYVYDYMRE